MPSPFPGMDPFLESPYWQSFHTQLASEMVRQLSPQVRPKYVALPAERVVWEMPDGIGISTREFQPDVEVLSSRRHVSLPGTAVATFAPPPVRLVTLMPERFTQTAVEIRDVRGRQLVTAIEILSPTNKRGDGWKEYLHKRRRVLISPAHLLELDLLHEGKRIPMEQPLPDAPYFVFLSRAEARPVVDVWPVHLGDVLPIVPVPLLSGDPDVVLDLQAALTAVYDTIGYGDLLDYADPPGVTLSAAESAWMEGCLRDAGLRPIGNV